MNRQMILLRVEQGVWEGWQWMALDDFLQRVRLDAWKEDEESMVGMILPAGRQGQVKFRLRRLRGARDESTPRPGERLGCLLVSSEEPKAVMNIGFIGLGNMGSAIAGRLLEAGHTLRVWNRSPEPARRLAERGAQVVATAEEAFRGDVVFSMLSDDQVTRAVLLDSGVLARATSGATRLHVNMATISAALGDELAERHASAEWVTSPRRSSVGLMSPPPAS